MHVRPFIQSKPMKSLSALRLSNSNKSHGECGCWRSLLGFPGDGQSWSRRCSVIRMNSENASPVLTGRGEIERDRKRTNMAGLYLPSPLSTKICNRQYERNIQTTSDIGWKLNMYGRNIFNNIYTLQLTSMQHLLLSSTELQ